MRLKNVRRLREVIAGFAASADEKGYCERFAMDAWFTLRRPGGRYSFTPGRLSVALAGASASPGDEPLVRFNPDPEARGCGTAACLAGWAQAIGTRDKLSTVKAAAGRGLAEDFAKRWLGLKADREADYLFSGTWRPTGTPLHLITPAMAVAILDRILATGEIDTSYRLPAWDFYPKPPA